MWSIGLRVLAASPKMRTVTLTNNDTIHFVYNVYGRFLNTGTKKRTKDVPTGGCVVCVFVLTSKFCVNRDDSLKRDLNLQFARFTCECSTI